MYRNLNILVDTGMAQRLESSRDKDRFDGQLPFHAHFRCSVCGKLYDIPVDTKEIIKEAREKSGHRIHAHNIEFTGICALCAEKK